MWGTEFTSNGHRFCFLSIPLPPAQESEPGWRLVLLCIPPPSRETETLTSAAWILISFLQNSCYVVCLWCWGLNFLRGPFMLFPAVCLSTALITSLINSLLTTIHLNVPLNPNLRPLSIEKRIKVFKEFRERSRCPVATASRGLCPPIAQANLKDSLF